MVLKLFTNLTSTRLLLVVVMANFGTFVTLNGLKAPVAATVPVYLTFGAVAFWCVRQLKFRKTAIVIDKTCLYMITAALLMLTFPRLFYLLDGLPGNTTFAHSDDNSRVLQILAMTGNSSYPLMSPSNIELPFSFYYEALYPFALMKLILPFLSIKEIIALGNLFYHCLILLSLYELAQVTFRDIPTVRFFLFLCTLFGGLDWLVDNDPYPIGGHYEWWQRRLLGNTQVSSFYSGMFWTIHHFTAAYTVILAYVTAFYVHTPKIKHLKLWVLPVLLAAAFYASPFAFMPVVLFAIVHHRLIRRILKSWITLPIVALSLIPLPIFLEKFPGQTFVWSTFRLPLTGDFFWDKAISAPLYLTLVPLVEMFGIPLALLFIWKHLSPGQKRYLIPAWIFFASTYIIAYSTANNYCMRGMFVPTFVFYLIFSRHWPRIKHLIRQSLAKRFKPAMVVLLILGSAGTLNETIGRTGAGVANSRLFRSLVEGSVPKNFTLPVYATARNRDVLTIPFELANQAGRKSIYDFEKFITGLELKQMQEWEKEQVRKPY